MIETEVKIKVEDFNDIEKTLQKFEWGSVKDFVFEDNFIFDFDELDLKKEGKLLRLRVVGDKVILTFKNKINKENSIFKEREEIEVQIGDYNKMKKILLGIGLRVFFRYQKFRKIYSLGENHICLDKTPVGNFIEIEGNKSFIMEFAKNLGFSETDFINKTYYELFMKSELKEKRENLVFKDK